MFLILEGEADYIRGGLDCAERSKQVVLEVEEKQRHLKMVRAGLSESPNSNSRPVYNDKVSTHIAITPPELLWIALFGDG